MPNKPPHESIAHRALWRNWILALIWGLLIGISFGITNVHRDLARIANALEHQQTEK